MNGGAINHNKNIASELPWKDVAPFSWKHFMIRCGSPECSLRMKMQPAMFARFRGIHFQTRWYHETPCLTGALVEAVKQMLPNAVPGRQRPHRLPLGLLLVKRGAITPQELREGLRLQRQAGTGKLGYWLRQFTALEEDQICAALSQQWGCPVFPLNEHTVPPLTTDAPPYPLLAAAKAVPVFTTPDGRQRHIAFSERVDHTLLYALEEILGCHTFPCVARESAVGEALEQFRRRSAGNEICFDTVRDPAEIAATICSYAAQMDIREVKVVPAGGCLWVAFFRKSVRRDLLFRVPSADPARTGEPLLPQIKALPNIDDMRRDGVAGAALPL
jgi:hypothetical protein